MKYEHIVSAVYEQPWAILPTKLAVILDLLAFRAAGNVLTEEEIQDRIGVRVPGTLTIPNDLSKEVKYALKADWDAQHVGAVAHPQRSRNAAVAVLSLVGVMSQRMNMMSAMSGGTSTELFGKIFKDAVADPAINGIVLDIDSPGGSVFGVQELAQTILDSRGEKPIIAFANSMAASAAFWIACAADEIVVTPGGQVGSIGVLTAHSDLSVALETAGEKITLISAGKKKVDANPIEPLSPEAKADLQATVNTYYASFVNAVAKGRGVTPAAVRSGFGEGGMVGAVEAVKQGMADRIGTLETAISRAAGRGREGFAARSGYSRIEVDGTNSSGTITTTNVTDGVGTVWIQDKSENVIYDSCQNEMCADNEYRTGKSWAECPDCGEPNNHAANDTDLRDRRLALQELTGNND